MKIRLHVGGMAATATLDDNATARDFVGLLPLTLVLEDYASAEKIAFLPRRLSTSGAPPGTSASVGDLMYYAPWGNLAIFYRDSGHADGLVRLGAVDGGVEALRDAGGVTVTVDLGEH